MTIEDIVEEIVGEIDDEYDAVDEDLVEADDGTYLVSTRMSITDFAEYFDVRIDVDDVTGLRLTALEGQGRRHRIAHVTVTRVDTPEEES